MSPPAVLPRYNKAQELVAHPELLLYFYSKTTLSSIPSSTALSVQLIYEHDFHKDIQDYQKTVLQINLVLDFTSRTTNFSLTFISTGSALQLT